MSSVKIEYGKTDDIIETFDFVKDDDYFASSDGIQTKEDFEKFYKYTILDACIAKYEDEIIAVGYILANSYKSAMFNGYFKKGFRTPTITRPIGKDMLNYFFKNWNINRIDILGRDSNRLSRLMAQRLGFKKVGIIKQFALHDDRLEDYYLSSLLKEDFYGKRRKL
jgi:RimJ/RimL family protein N-acetyltransferase